MRIKKYEAETMREAIAKVKQDFGSQAIILHSKNIKRGGVMGLFGKDCVEVLAGVDINIIEKKNQMNDSARTKVITPKSTREEIKQPEPTPKTTEPEVPVETDFEKPTTLTEFPDPVKETKELAYETESISEMQDRIDSIESGINKILFRLNTQTSNLPYRIPGMENIHAGLLSCGISKRIIDDILVYLFDNYAGKELKNSDRLKTLLTQAVQTRVRVSGQFELKEDKTNYIAVIGPTGVGKTTTIAKLAANYTLFESKSVGLITIDTYRIAAIEQLRTFANIMNIDLEVVYTPQELVLAMNKFRTHELVLIDTAGRSPHNKDHMNELRNFLAVTDNNLTRLLVLSLTSKLENLLNVIHRFEPIGYDHLILTKADETKTYGGILDLTSATRKPISYLSTGQNVPEDLEIADAKQIANKILKNMKEHW